MRHTSGLVGKIMRLDKVSLYGSLLALSLVNLPGLAQAQPALPPGSPSPSDQPAGDRGAPRPFDRRQQMQWIEDFAGHRAVTRPSRDAAIGFTLPTSVLEVLVTGGQRVKQGDLLIRGDDREDLAEAEFQKARADTPLPVERAQADVDLAKLEFDRAQEAFSREGLSPAEYERANARFIAANIDLELSRLNQTLAALQADRSFARVDKYRLLAPFDGTVDAVSVDVGQNVPQGDPVIRIVNVNPLWIDVPVPTQDSLSLSPDGGEPAWILMPILDEPRVYQGKVIEVAPTADAASGTRRVRVEVPNAELVPPGLNCWVRFAPPSSAWDERIVQTTSMRTPEASTLRQVTGSSGAVAEGTR